MISLQLPSAFRQQVRILLAGAGGNGSAMLNGLARMDLALRELGHPGLSVTLCDPDRVSPANVGRQMFSPADVGAFKCDTLIQRVNLFYGLDWTALPQKLDGKTDLGAAGQRNMDLLITCVDTAAARRTIGKACVSRSHGTFCDWWLDLGNEARTGQFVLGNLREKLNHLDFTISNKEWAEGYQQPEKIPHVLDLFPALADPKFKESNAPSCSVAESLRKQDLFINQTVATFALDLLWDWFRRGSITAHGGFINLETKTVRPLPIDPAVWARMRGVAVKKKRPTSNAQRSTSKAHKARP